MSRRKTKSLEQVIAELLPDIDEVFAVRSEPLYSRPYRAAMLVVEACVVSVKGDTKDRYHTKAWFGAILAAVNEWYGEVYGEAMAAHSPIHHAPSSDAICFRRKPTSSPARRPVA